MYCYGGLAVSKHILVPVDGSDPAFKALDFASHLAANDGSTLHLLHVVPMHGIPHGLRKWAAVEHVQEPMHWLYDQAIVDNILNAAVDRATDHGAVSLKKHIGHGDAAKKIVEVAEYNQIDTIIMGTRGLSQLQGVFLGHVARQVNHLAKCTVVTVH